VLIFFDKPWVRRAKVMSTQHDVHETRWHVCSSLYLNEDQHVLLACFLIQDVVPDLS
jgi:hypothetical protein